MNFEEFNIVEKFTKLLARQSILGFLCLQEKGAAQDGGDGEEEEDGGQDGARLEDPVRLRGRDAGDLLDHDLARVVHAVLCRGPFRGGDGLEEPDEDLSGVGEGPVWRPQQPGAGEDDGGHRDVGLLGHVKRPLLELLQLPGVRAGALGEDPH